MADIYEPGWVSCLDESISIWTNKWTCPGWTFIPRKPHPFGNEYHTICCGTTGILYQMEMVEGKDMPKEVKMARNVKRCEETIGLLLRLTRSLYSTGKVVILDSDLCVLRGLIELRKVGVFASALIKKRRYWPRYVPGDAINKKMKDKKVGECDSLKGVLDGQNYDIFCLKEPDYVMKVMSTYGGLVVKSGQEDSRRTWMEGDEEKTARFQYMEPFANHFDYRHLVDDHNLLRHMVPSIEETWTTDRWANRVFAYLLATSEINSYLAMKHWLWKDEKETVHYHWKQLALELINWAKDHGEDDIDESGRVTTRKKVEESGA